MTDTKSTNGNNAGGTREATRHEKWTIMFYCAVNNELSPLIISQIQSIKNAGFQKDCDVLVYLDSNQKEAPTQLFFVNQWRRNLDDDGTLVGEPETSFVPDFIEDAVLPRNLAKIAKPGDIVDQMAQLLMNPDSAEFTAEKSLRTFINYARVAHEAEHYILVLIGHGMVVGSDLFLPDDEPKSAVSLKILGEITTDFAAAIGKQEPKGALEVLALHSCSMSAIEVAYELQGTSTYLLASEGLSYMGSWPYRNVLMKLFKNLDNRRKGITFNEIPTLVRKLHAHTMFGATNFMLSGFSSDLSLCNLDSHTLGEFRVRFRKFVVELKNGLADERFVELVQLAHLRSQSYWGEQYTDLYDFCVCLKEVCNPDNKSVAPRQSILDAADAVIGILEQEDKHDAGGGGIVIRSDYYGAGSQYSHGLSIYFPWTKPPVPFTTDQEIPADHPLRRYQEYRFSNSSEGEWGNDSWFTFLTEYWKATRRKATADGTSGTVTVGSGVANAVTGVGVLAGTLEGPGKQGAGGDNCTCPSIKNYEIINRQIPDLRGDMQTFPMSRRLAGIFTSEVNRTKKHDQKADAELAGRDEGRRKAVVGPRKGRKPASK
jgi:hypothetical protein